MVTPQDFIETQILELPTKQIVVACSQRTAEEGLFAWSQSRFSSTRKVKTMYVPNLWESTVHTSLFNTFSRLHRMKGLKAEVQFTQKRIKTTNKKAKLRLLKEANLQRYLSFLVCLCNCQRVVTEQQSRVYNLGLGWLFDHVFTRYGTARPPEVLQRRLFSLFVFCT